MSHNGTRYLSCSDSPIIKTWCFNWSSSCLNRDVFNYSYVLADTSYPGVQGTWMATTVAFRNRTEAIYFRNRTEFTDFTNKTEYSVPFYCCWSVDKWFYTVRWKTKNVGFCAKYFFVLCQAWHSLLVLLIGTTACNHFLIKYHYSKSQIFQWKSWPLAVTSMRWWVVLA